MKFKLHFPGSSQGWWGSIPGTHRGSSSSLSSPWRPGMLAQHGGHLLRISWDCSCSSTSTSTSPPANTAYGAPERESGHHLWLQEEESKWGSSEIRRKVLTKGWALSTLLRLWKPCWEASRDQASLRSALGWEASSEQDPTEEVTGTASSRQSSET